MLLLVGYPRQICMNTSVYHPKIYEFFLSCMCSLCVDPDLMCLVVVVADIILLHPCL
jgi:hypothetical protein